jgi:copper(I)-binding protein
MNRRTVLSLFPGVVIVAVVSGRMVPALAADAKSANGFIELAGVWARPSGPNERTVYLDIVNHSTTDDRLVGISSPQAERCVLEKTRWKGLVVKNVPVDDLAIPAMTRTLLKPGGTYIHALHLTPGDDRGPLALTLRFANNGEIDVTAEISARMLGPPR